MFYEDYTDNVVWNHPLLPDWVQFTWNFSKIASHGRSWRTNLCSKPSQSERGKRTEEANFSCQLELLRGIVSLTSLAADQPQFQPWLNKAWAKKTSVTQLHDAESSRGSPINYFRTGAGDRLVIVTVKRGEGQKKCSKNLHTSFMDGPSRRMFAWSMKSKWKSAVSVRTPWISVAVFGMRTCILRV